MLRNSPVALARHWDDQVKDSDSKRNALANAQLLAVTLHTALRRGAGDRVTLPRFVAKTALDAAGKLVRYLEAEEARGNGAG
jgi:hypothetical protein